VPPANLEVVPSPVTARTMTRPHGQCYQARG
jgi:hypothetical protein